MNWKLFLPVVLVLLLTACSPAPQPIDFGTDICSHCKMTIVDMQHAAELVTEKGKVFKFDAIECMLDYLKAYPETAFAFYLVRDFNQPEEWQDARSSHYLISQAVSSPMGAYLSAFAEENAARQLVESKGGEVYDWEKLLEHLK